MTFRGYRGLAILLFSVSRTPADEDSTAFLTAPQADLYASPVDSPTVTVSGNGRYIAFTSYARLTPEDPNDYPDVYVLDRTTGRVTLETASPSGDVAHASPHLSGDGRLLLYERNGGTIDADTRVLVLRDRWAGTSRTIGPPDGVANNACRSGVISADGRLVLFTSSATNLVNEPDANGAAEDVYRYDVASATISRVSLDQTGRQPAVGASFAPAVSADGRYVAFSSTAPLDGQAAVSRTARPAINVYVRDLAASVTTRVSARPDGAPPNGPSYDAAINAGGRYVAFVSEATDLVRGDGNRAPDIFLFDASTRTTALVSRSEGAGSANGTSRHPVISAAGTIVSFQSDASDLTCSRRCAAEIRDINLVADVFIYDVRTRVVRRISTGRRSWREPSIGPSLDASGAVIAFSSRHPRDSRDDGDDYDLFVRLPEK
jgi:Tol biopolymer transport system component